MQGRRRRSIRQCKFIEHGGGRQRNSIHGGRVSDIKDKTNELLKVNIVELKGKDDDSNILTADQTEKPKEHEDGEGDHIIHIDNLESYYFGYDDLAKEDVDKNDDHNEDYEGSNKNPNKEEDHKNEIFSEEYYSHKNPDEDPNEDIGKRLEGKENCSKDEDTKDKQLDQEYEGDDSEYKEIDKELDISDDEGFSPDNKDETDKVFILVEVDPAYEETSLEGGGNGLDQQTKELGLDYKTKDDSMTSTKEAIINLHFGKSKIQEEPGRFQKRQTQRKGRIHNRTP
eukprot:Gb_20053 [translate_table: standard]